jgi:hypothetical protein
MKKILGVLLLSASLILPNIASAADTPDEQWKPPKASAPDTQGFYVSESNMLSTQGSYLINYTTSDGTEMGKVTNVALCATISDPGCGFAAKTKYNAVIPMCASDSDVDCISAVTAKDSSGKLLPVTSVGQFPTRRLQDFAANPSINLPAGGGAALLDIPGASHPGGTKYLLKVTLKGFHNSNMSEQKFNSPQLESSFYAIKTVSGDFGDVYIDTTTANYDSINRITGVDTERGDSKSLCVVKSKNECGLAYPMPDGFTFGYSLRLSNPIIGWLHGRMKSPVITLTQEPSGVQNLTVSAEPTHVPAVSTWVANSNIPAELSNYYGQNDWSGSATRYGSGQNYGGPPTAEEKSPSGQKTFAYQHVGALFNESGMKEFLLWLPLLKDTAAANPTLWTLNTMMNAGDNGSKVTQCLRQTNSLAGVVTTNATMYLDGPPTYIASQGTLDYKVASTHFEPDGKTVFKGTYDLVMSSKVARCIYGFTAAPINATISVTSESGEPNIATTVVSEKNGWLSLGAYNFTFSNPTIAVKLSQAAPAPAKTTAKKITCVKGKTTKVVTTATCPAGFKKK